MRNQEKWRNENESEERETRRKVHFKFTTGIRSEGKQARKGLGK